VSAQHVEQARLPASRFGPSAQNWSRKTPCSTWVNRVPSSIDSNSKDATDVDMWTSSSHMSYVVTMRTCSTMSV